MRILDAMRARARLVFRGGASDSRMAEEMRFHVEMEADRLVREHGLSREEAWRRAQLAFGGQERYGEEMRAGRDLAWLGGLALDFRLGARTLLKYPVLTLAGVVTMAIAVALAASCFEFMYDFLRPRLPLPDGDRVVMIQYMDVSTGEQERRVLHDYEAWRTELASIEDLTASSTTRVNVITDDGRFATLNGARITASGFRLVRVAPILGRPLTDDDEDAGAPLVAVLSHSAWQTMFDGSRLAIGQSIQLGAEHATVVGVMPEGFGFPFNQEIWTPLRENALKYERLAGPPIGIAGRLAPGYSLDQARAELAAISSRAAAATPATHGQLRARVSLFGVQQGFERYVIALGNIPLLLFLLVVAVNVAALHFARMAARAGELALRSALGASRRRLILQLVAEALVLTTAAAALGLALAHQGLRWGMELLWDVQQMRPPFWFDSGLSGITFLYAAVLALISAAVIGGLPAWRATGRQLRDRLAQPGTGGTAMRFGAIATIIIVVQVALSVAFIPVAIMSGRDLLAEQTTSDFPAHAFLAVELTRPADAASSAGGDESYAQTMDEAWRRLAAEPGVAVATRASRLPGFNHPGRSFDIDADPARVVDARAVAVADNFFDVMEARIIAGRDFRPEDGAGGDGADVAPDVAIVTQVWAEAQFPGGSAVGQRIRFASRSDAEPGAWHEIVGVVAGMERAIGPGTPVSIYLPFRSERHASMLVYLRTDRAPETLVPQVQPVVSGVDPRVGIPSVQRLDDVWRPVQRANVFFATALSVIAAIILLFALVGIYALMSFTVAQRAREIGIRAALGADARRIVMSIFSRAMRQIGLGVVAGGLLVSLTVAGDPAGLRLVGGVAAMMVVFGLIGCALPARRALRIQPTEALRAE